MPRENERLSAILAQYVPFSEQFFVNDEDVRFYTGLPNVKLLRFVFDDIKAGVISPLRHKHTDFQEMAVALDLIFHCTALHGE